VHRSVGSMRGHGCVLSARVATAGAEEERLGPLSLKGTRGLRRPEPRAQEPPVVNLIAMREPKETREAEVPRAGLAAELHRRLDALGPLGLLTPARPAHAAG